MEKKTNLRFRKGDLIAVLLVVILAAGTAAAFFPERDASPNAAVQIFQDGRMIEELSLQTECSLEIGGEYTNIVSIQDGRVAITQSGCPGEDCVHSGWIGSPGRSIVCLPNRVEIRIVGTADVDFVVG